MLRKLYVIAFVYAINAALTSYINSTFLSHKVSVAHLSILFSIAAVCSFIFIQQSPRLITRFGVKRTTLYLVFANIVGLLGLLFGSNPIAISLAFVVYITTNNATAYTLDLFLEHHTREQNTGKTRGMYITISNIGWMISPYIASVTLVVWNIRAPYFLALCASIIAFVMFTLLTHEERITHKEQNTFSRSIMMLKRRPNIARIVYIGFILQFFYAWMLIYAPLYLHDHIGLSYTAIGTIFTLMLAPFVILTVPLGKLADKKYGEKELLFVGVFVMCIATLAVAYTKSTSILVWIGIFVATRIGAAVVESMSETYFFRMIDDQDAGLLSVFRATTPLAFTIGPLMASLLLRYTDYKHLFILLAVCIVTTLVPLYKLRDTR